jgi:PAS domain S-box-containing protein
MHSLLEKLLSRTLNDRSLTMQQRQYRLVCGLVAAISLWLILPANLLLGLPVLVDATTITLGAYSYYCLRQARQGRYSPRAFFLVLLFLMNLAWFPNSGSQGSMAYYYLCAAAVPVILFRGRERWVFGSLLPLNVIGLLLLEQACPWLATPFASNLERLVDLILGTAFGTLLLTMSVWVATSSHDRERLMADRFSRDLATSERNYRDLVETANVLILGLDRDGIITFCNRFAEETLGRSRTEIAGKKLAEFVFNVTPFPGNPANPGSAPTRWDSEHERPDGVRLWINWVLQPVEQAEGTPSELLCVGTDITERKQAEERRQELEAQTQRTQKLESLGILAGGIAHDFNNVLMVITGNLSLAREGLRPGSEEAELTAEAEKAAMRARELTRQLLTFAKGGSPIRAPLAIEPVLKRAAELALGGSGIPCHLTIAGDTAPVHGDAGQLAQLFNNLIQNARQAMPNGGQLFIDVTHRAVAPGDRLPVPPGRYVQIEVRDTGIGIPEAHLSRIFDPYFTTKDAGSGLGLAVVHSIVKSHRGAIAVASKEGQGASFTISLPASPHPVPSAKTAAAPSPRRGGRILVMDDEDAVRSTALRMVQRLGHEADGAADGVEALAKYAEAQRAGRRYDLVIMDLTIPGGMGGKEAIGRLKQLDPTARAVVSSGYSNDPVMASHRDYGFVAVMTKPYSHQDLQIVLEQALPPV